MEIPKETIQGLNRISKAIDNAAKEMGNAKIAIDKLTYKEPKWWEFWKWDYSLFTDRPPIELYWPTIDRTTQPPTKL